MLVQDTILREVERYQRSHIQHGTAYGELDHPSYDSITFRELHMATVSHQVTHESLKTTVSRHPLSLHAPAPAPCLSYIATYVQLHKAALSHALWWATFALQSGTAQQS